MSAIQMETFSEVGVGFGNLVSKSPATHEGSRRIVDLYSCCVLNRHKIWELCNETRPFTISAVLIMLVLAVNCGGGSIERREMLSLTLQPAFAAPAAGADVHFNAAGIFDKPRSPAKVNPLIRAETALDGLRAGTGVAAVDQSGLAHCNRSGKNWITATALSGALNRFGDPALVRGTAQLNCP